MTVSTVAHLNFRGTARSALTFYQSVFGGRLAIVSYRDAGILQDGAEADEVMWGQVESDQGFRVMAFDAPASVAWNPGENAYFVSVRGETAAEIESYWAKLSDGATTLQPLAPAGWSPLYGKLRDRYGVVWVLDVAVQYQAA